jgi:hypothetical protein
LLRVAGDYHALTVMTGEAIIKLFYFMHYLFLALSLNYHHAAVSLFRTVALYHL